MLCNSSISEPLHLAKFAAFYISICFSRTFIYSQFINYIIVFMRPSKISHFSQSIIYISFIAIQSGSWTNFIYIKVFLIGIKGLEIFIFFLQKIRARNISSRPGVAGLFLMLSELWAKIKVTIVDAVDASHATLALIQGQSAMLLTVAIIPFILAIIFHPCHSIYHPCHHFFHPCYKFYHPCSHHQLATSAVPLSLLPLFPWIRHACSSQYLSKSTKKNYKYWDGNAVYFRLQHRRK